MKQKLPIGLSDFKRLIEDNYYYVDKSLFIKEIIDSGAGVILLPRPRRFGKTLNLSMLRHFFEKSGTDTSCLFKGLKIWETGAEYTGKQGQYPVIFLTFKDVKCNTWGNCLESMKSVVADEYRRHKYLFESAFLDEGEKNEFQEIMYLKSSETAFGNSLKKLCRYLGKYYKNRVIVLIDEYDIPIQSGYLNGYYQEVVDFMRTLLGGALKDNESLEKGVLTGILRVAKESIFSGLNNLEVSTLLNYEYADKFGLLEEEVEELLKHYGIAFQMRDVRNWYNGYVFGQTVVYNPWSIINYASKWREGLKPYWINTSSNDLVKNILTRAGKETKRELEALIQGESIKQQINENIVFGEVENSSKSIWSFLLFSGYLKYLNKELVEGMPVCELKIPNAEVRFLYKQIIMSWFEESIYNDKLNLMLKSLTTGEIKTFGKIFKEFVAKTFSYFDTGGQEPEKVYHAFVLGLLVTLNQQYEVSSNGESGYGRYDVMLIPQDHSKIGIIMEFKKVDEDENEDLKKAAELALEQIEAKNYRQKLIDRGIKEIIEIGIAFEGKKVLTVERKVK